MIRWEQQPDGNWQGFSGEVAVATVTRDDEEAERRLGCFLGTFSPWRRQIRSTRLSLMSQPARRSSSAILR